MFRQLGLGDTSDQDTPTYVSDEHRDRTNERMRVEVLEAASFVVQRDTEIASRRVECVSGHRVGA